MTAHAVTRWWWIRHAPVTCHGGKIYGQDDLPADCSDEALFGWLAPLMPDDAVWVRSNLQRTAQTAAAIRHAAEAAGVVRDWPDPAIEPDLAEQHFGEWQGQSHAELLARGDGFYHRFWWAPAHEVPPGGESFEQVVGRVRDAVTRLTAAHRGRDIVAVAHGGSIKAAIAVALDLAPEQALAFSIDNCALTRLDFIEGDPAPGQEIAEPSWRVNAINLHPRSARVRG